ncbi:MAG: hydroxylamine reductase [Desulfarculales bacterium]|nr:hydroxylamine reductase [Desulfarculales bacterium]
MFCFQCQQTAGGKACTGKAGLCGKPAATAALQDQLTGALITLAQANPARDPALDRKVIEGLFATVTNVNFSGDEVNKITERVRADLAVESTYAMDDLWKASEDVRTIKSLILFGIRGIAAYACHALALGYSDDEVSGFFYEALAAIGDKQAGQDKLLALLLETGKVNYKCMELLDQANTSAYGTPLPTKVTQTIEAGPFIVVSGHDLHDLKLLLEQAEGKGVNIYTHGEMLPAHAYPELKKHARLKGNFGTAWQNQQKEFADVPAAFLFTSNCLMPPRVNYADRVFTTSAAEYPGVAHIGKDKDFSAVIEKAIALGGYAKPHTVTGINGGKSVMTGFGHGAVLSVADTLIEAVKAGAIKHFFLIGGCDGADPRRSYFTDFVKQAPKDTVILTLGCGKYRFNDLDLGEISGLPRILDMGQCNDSYSAIKVALALANAFGCSVNGLPLSFILSWYEQKAVSVLLSLLYLGIKNIRLGPTLPAFVSPGVLSFLAENFGIALTTTAGADISNCIAGPAGPPPGWLYKHHQG